MEFTINRQVFLSGLSKVQGIVDKKSTVNVLSHVLLTTTPDGGLDLLATDYDVTVQGQYTTEVIEPGRLAVNGRSLFDVVKALPDRPIQVRGLDNHWAEIRCGRAEFKLTGMQPDDFPRFDWDELVGGLTLPKAVLSRMIERTAFSVSTDETRLALNGVYFQIQPTDSGSIRLVMVSTDGHRLSMVEELIEDPGYTGEAANAIIHRKGTGELRRMLEGPDENTRVALIGADIVVENDGNRMRIRQIEESFPDYTKVIPTQSNVRASMPRDGFIDAIRRIATLTSSKTSIIRLELGGTPGPGGESLVRVSSSNPETGEAHDAIECDYAGEPLTVGFNFRYLLDALSSIEGETVHFEMQDAYSPGVLRPADGGSGVYVIMPMRI